MSGNFDIYKNLLILEASTASELQERLKSIRVPIRILQIYSDGKKHYAAINTNRKLGVNNGSTSK